MGIILSRGFITLISTQYVLKLVVKELKGAGHTQAPWCGHLGAQAHN